MVKKTLWNVKKEEISKLPFEDLVELTRYRKEVEERKKIVKSLRLNYRLNRSSIKHTGGTSALKSAREDIVKRKVANQTEIAKIVELGKEASKVFKRSKFLTTYTDQMFKQKFFDLDKTNYKKQAVIWKAKLRQEKLAAKKVYLTAKNQIFKKYKVTPLNYLSKFLKDPQFNLDITIARHDRNEQVAKVGKNLKFRYDIVLEQSVVGKAKKLSLFREEQALRDSYAQKFGSLTAIGKDYLKKPWKRPATNAQEELRISNEYKASVANLWKKYRTRTISWKAFTESWTVLRKNRKHSYKALFLQNKDFLTAQEVRTMRNSMRRVFKHNRAAYQSEIDEVFKRYPTDVKPWMVYIYPAISIFFPGFFYLTQRQWKTAFLNFLIFPVIVVLLFYSLGAFNANGEGWFGLADLGLTSKNTFNPSADSRFYAIEGTLAVIFTSIIAVYMVVTYKVFYTKMKLMLVGINTSTWTETKTAIRGSGFPYLMSIPALAVIVFITVLPLISTMFFSLTNYGIGAQPPGQVIKWIGVDNYTQFLTQGDFYKSFSRVAGWTFAFAIIASVLSAGLGIFFGILTNNEKIKGRKFFRFIFLLPAAVPTFITATMFALMFAPTGFLSDLLKEKRWTTDGLFAQIGIIFVQTWLTYKVTYLMTIGTIASVPKDQLEAARIDGVSARQSLLHLVLPIIAYQLTPTIVVLFLFTYNDFSIVYLFLNGGPDYAVPSIGTPGQTDTIVSFIVKLSNSAAPYIGMGAALTFFSAIITMPIAVATMLGSRSFRKESL